MHEVGQWIYGGTVLMPDGVFAERDVRIENGRIAAVEVRQRRREGIDASGLLVLPAMIDLHGDAFEGILEPRPGVQVPHRLALLEADRQLVSNGIGTAFHSVTISWEPGLRSLDAGRRLLDEIEAARPHLQCDTRFHLRFETFAFEAETQVTTWLREGRVDLLSFNDHTRVMPAHFDRPDKMMRYTQRTGLAAEALRERVRDVLQAESEVAAMLHRLASVARECGVPMASHDDELVADRRSFRALGAGLCEFPCNAETAQYARHHDEPVILGAPNVLRGGSHNGNLGAADAVGRGLCTVLTTDYYYPSLLQAAFRLAADEVCALADAWRLVASGPAAAAGLPDRGMLAIGQRADILLVDAETAGVPVVRMTLSNGRLAFSGHRDARIPVASDRALA